MKKQKLIIFLICLILLFLLSGCGGVLNKNTTEDDKTPILAGDTSQLEPLSCMVYFSLADKFYLVAQQHLVSVPETKRAEEIILQELISGPKTGTGSLKPVINPNTRIISVSDNNSLLFITLSSHFLDPLPATPENWRDDESWYQLVMAQKRLALYSIVNTMTQTGKYSKIQLFIDYDDTEQGRRPTRNEMGFIDDDSGQLLEPVGRNPQIIFGPDTSVRLFLTSFSEKNWDEASFFVAGSQQAEQDDNLSSQFSLLDLTLVAFEITSITTSYDGQSAIVTLDYFIKGKDSAEYENDNVSLLMVRIDDIWKISYVSINQLLNVSNG